jgi:lysozyme family protein
MSVPKYSERWPTYARQWDIMARTRLTDLRTAAKKILAHKARYQAVEKRTGVPWYWIGPTHYRESDLDFNTQLAQGDPLGRVSTHVPRGQGPYFGKDAWERAALIALEDTGATNVKDWRLEKLIYHWENYNGWGYKMHGVPSPYVWGGSSIQKPGKYVADGVWSSTAVDRQLGCASILKTLMELDPSIKLARETPVRQASAAAAPVRPGLMARVRGWFGG